MSLLILLRHLPTLDDLSNIYTPPDAEIPFALSIKDEIERLTQEIDIFLNTHNVRKIYCSNNPRGINTAKEICTGLTCPVELEYDSSLNNILQPEWSGLSQEIVKSTSLYNTWHTDPGSVKFRDGEMLLDVDCRVKKFLQSLNGERGLIISHTTPMQVILCNLFGIDVNKIWRFKFDHCRFTVLWDHILLRYNTRYINDIDLNEIRR